MRIALSHHLVISNFNCTFTTDKCIYNCNGFVVCDPVLGDNGHWYVPKELLPIYQNEIIPLSDICTPNQFEAEQLTGIEVRTEADAWLAMDWFHRKGVKTVVISSTKLNENGNLTAFVSHKTGKHLHIDYIERFVKNHVYLFIQCLQILNV